MIGSTERRCNIRVLAIVGTGLAIVIYCIFYLKDIIVEQAKPTTLQFLTNASAQTSSLYVASRLPEEISNDAEINYWSDLSESEAKQLVSTTSPFFT
jgi:hypothetical protein